MIKKDELSTPTSCINKAKEWELIFVLLARDKAAPFTILTWCRERIRLGLNKRTDIQIIEARNCAKAMKKQLSEGII